MPQEERNKKLEEIFYHYGYYNQIGMLQEEAAEVIQAVNKFRRHADNSSFDNLCEEIADLKNVLDQIISYIGQDHIQSLADKKIERQLRRITDEKKTNKDTMEV